LKDEFEGEEGEFDEESTVDDYENIDISDYVHEGMMKLRIIN
jgi:hypothetical protein